MVVASYRQNVHAYPSGGGDYEVATVNLGPTAGLTVASALLVDYVLTVAVSVSSGAAVRRRGHPGPARARGARSRSLLVLVLMAANLRGLRESGAAFAVPTYIFMVVGAGDGACAGCVRLLFGDLPRRRQRQPRARRRARRLQAAWASSPGPSSCCGPSPPAAAALTGVEAISNGVPAFRKPKSKNAATTLLLLGADRVTMLVGIVALARAHRHPLRGGPRDPAAARRRAGGRRLRPGPDHRPARGDGLRPLPGGLLRRHRRHRRHPGAGREHRVQRLPGAGLDPGPRRLPAQAAAHPRGPARLLQRHHRPRGRRHRPHRRLRRRGHPAHPALHRRGLRLLHDEPDRHDPALDPAAAERDRTPRARARCCARGSSTASGWA